MSRYTVYIIYAQRRTTKVETCGAILVSKMYTVHTSRYIDYKCGPYDRTVAFCDLQNFYREVQLLVIAFVNYIDKSVRVGLVSHLFKCSCSMK